MSPTVRLARVKVELGQAAADLFTRRYRRRHLRVVKAAPAPVNGHLPPHFRQLPGLAPAPYDREQAA